MVGKLKGFLQRVMTIVGEGAQFLDVKDAFLWCEKVVKDGPQTMYIDS